MTSLIARAALLVAAAATLGGCRSLDRFDTTDGVAYCGSMLASPFISDGFTPDDQPPKLRLRLTLQMSQLDTIPGTLSSDDTAGLCAPKPLFSGADLRAIKQVQSDQLWLLDFGDGRDQNFLAWVDSSCQGTMLAVVSLMKNDDVEVRLLKPAATPDASADAAHRPGFALVPMVRRKGTCGF